VAQKKRGMQYIQEMNNISKENEKEQQQEEEPFVSSKKSKKDLVAAPVPAAMNTFQAGDVIAFKHGDESFKLAKVLRSTGNGELLVLDMRPVDKSNIYRVSLGRGKSVRAQDVIYVDVEFCEADGTYILRSRHKDILIYF